MSPVLRTGEGGEAEAFDGASCSDPRRFDLLVDGGLVDREGFQVVLVHVRLMLVTGFEPVPSLDHWVLDFPEEVQGLNTIVCDTAQQMR